MFTDKDVLNGKQAEGLEKIVEDAIKDVEKAEDLKPFSTENTLDCKELMLKMNQYTVDIHRNHIEHNNKMNSKQNKILENLTQHNKFTYGLVAVAGVLIGMSDHRWMPYASWLYELGKEIIGKGS